MNTDLTALLIQGFAGGITGYVTNNYALNMLFREYTPLKLGGVIKKTKTEFIEAISELVEKDLLSPSHLKSEILKDDSLVEWNLLFASLWDEFFEAEFQNKPIQDIPGVQKALPLWVNSLVEDALQPLQDGTLSIPEIKIESLLSKSGFSFLYKRLITQSIAEAQQGKMLDSFSLALTAPLNGKSLSTFLSKKEVEMLETKLQELLSKGRETLQKDPVLFTNALTQFFDSEEIGMLLARMETEWGHHPFSASLSMELHDEWVSQLHRLLSSCMEPSALGTLAVHIQDSFASSDLLDHPLLDWFEKDAQASIEEFLHNAYGKLFDRVQAFLGDHENELRERLKRAAQTELNQQSGMLASMIQGPLFSYLDQMNIPELVEGFRNTGETKIREYLATRPVSDWMPLPSKESLTTTLQSGLTSIDNRLESLIEKGIEKTPVQILGPNWAKRYTQTGKFKLQNLLASLGQKILSDEDTQERAVSSALGALFERSWSEDTCIELLDAMKKLDLQPVQQALLSLDENLYDMIKEKSIPSAIWQSILKNPSLQASLEEQALDLMGYQIQQPLAHFLSRFNQAESRDAFGERLIKIIETHGETALEGKVQELVKTNLQSRNEEEIVELAHDFIGRELQPITKFGFLLGLMAGIALALFPLPRTLMIGPVDLFPIGVFASVGVITNWIALQMIFKPYKEIRWLKRIPFFRHFAHGYLLKNQRVFAENLAQFVDESLLNRNMIQQLFSDQKKNLKQRWINWLPTRISNWLQSGVDKGHGELASAFTQQIQLSLTTHATQWSTSITERLGDRPLPLDNQNLQLWLAENGSPLIQKGWNNWQETHLDESISSWISPNVISAVLQPALQRQAGKSPVKLLWNKGYLAIEPALVSQLTPKQGESFEDFLFGAPANLVRERQTQIISTLFARGVNELQIQEQVIADRLNQSVQSQLNFLQRGGFVLMGGPALLGKILHRAMFDELPDFLDKNSASLLCAINPAIADILKMRPSTDWKMTKPTQESIGRLGTSIVENLPSIQRKLPLTEEKLSGYVQTLIQNEQSWLLPAMAQGICTLSHPVLEQVTFSDLLSLLPTDGKQTILKSISSSPDYQANIREGWNQITDTLGRNTVIGDWIPASLLAEQLESLLLFMGSDSTFTALFQEITETAIPGLTDHLSENANLMEWVSENSFDPLYRATHAHLPALLATLSFQDHIVREVEALSPQGIHQLFLSFAGKYFLRLEIYGLFGAVFGLHPVLPALALVSEGWETIKRNQKKEFPKSMEKICQVKKNHETKFRQGYPLLFPEAVRTTAPLQKEGEIFRLTNQAGEFIARGYYGKQNKGLGWILTHKEEEAIDFSFFIRKLSAALARRQKFYFSDETTTFRVFNGEGDGIGGLTIDYYDGYYLFQWYSKGIYAFHEEIYRAFSQITVSKGIYQKRRYQVGGKVIEEDSYVSGERFDQTFPVKESGVLLNANLNDGAMTGFFFDQRNVRKQIMDLYAANRRVLNTFSYTGAFSVFAAKGGAASTTSIDLAKRSLEKTKDNFILNGLDLDTNEIIVDEISAYFAAAKEEGKRFDLIILDPPSYSRSKTFSFSAQKDYTALVEQALPILDTNGILLASTNCSLFDMKEFQEMVKKGFRKFNRRYRVLESFQLPADFPAHPEFPEGNYLKVFFIQHEK